MSNSSSELSSSSSSSSSLTSSFSTSRLLSSILKCLSFSLSSSLLGVSRFTSDFFNLLSFRLFSIFNLLHKKKMNSCLQENKRTRNYNNHYYILYTLYIKCPKNIAILRKEHAENLTKNSLQQVLHISTEFTLQERKK